MSAYFLISFLILAILLFFPVSKLIWVMSVRRLEYKTKVALTSLELQHELKRARVIAAVVVFVFSYLFVISIGLRP